MIVERTQLQAEENAIGKRPRDLDVNASIMSAAH